MREQTKRTGAQRIMTGEDIAVGAASTVALTQPWWGVLFSAIPDVAQGLIVLATVVYVLARAINEVKKFWDPKRKDSE